MVVQGYVAGGGRYRVEKVEINQPVGQVVNCAEGSLLCYSPCIESRSVIGQDCHLFGLVK